MLHMEDTDGGEIMHGRNGREYNVRDSPTLV